MSKSITRRSFAALVGGTAITAALPIAMPTPPNTPSRSAQRAGPIPRMSTAKAAERSSRRRRQIRAASFPQQSARRRLGHASQLRSGALECFLNSGVNVLSTLIPAAAISAVGFAFKDYPAVWNALDGSSAQTCAADHQGRHRGLDKIWDNGFRRSRTARRPSRPATSRD